MSILPFIPASSKARAVAWKSLMTDDPSTVIASTSEEKTVNSEGAKVQIVSDIAKPIEQTSLKYISLEEALRRHRMKEAMKWSTMRTTVGEVASDGSVADLGDLDDLEEDINNEFVKKVIAGKKYINSKNENGRTALFYADEDECIKLLRQGCNPLLTDNQGKKPFEYNRIQEARLFLAKMAEKFRESGLFDGKCDDDTVKEFFKDLKTSRERSDLPQNSYSVRVLSDDRRRYCWKMYEKFKK